MKIEIREDVFQGTDFKSFNFLFQILTWFPNNSIRRYDIFIDLPKILTSETYLSLTTLDQEIIQEQFNSHILSDEKIKFIISNTNQSGSNHTFNLKEAIRYFNQPISIVLENSKNDSSFLVAVIKYIEKKNDQGFLKINEFIKNSWIQFENAGGCSNVENFILGKLQSYDEISLENNKESHHYLRCFVLLDSDREFPAQKQKDLYVNLVVFLQSKVITYHILSKRAMENYLPDEVFDYINDKSISNWIGAYKSLSNTQKDFLDYKRGFLKKGPNNNSIGTRNGLKEEVKELYNDVSDKNFNTLDKGLQINDFKNEFPKLFQHHQVNSKTLLNRLNSNESIHEFEQILNKISQLL